MHEKGSKRALFAFYCCPANNSKRAPAGGRAPTPQKHPPGWLNYAALPSNGRGERGVDDRKGGERQAAPRPRRSPTASKTKRAPTAKDRTPFFRPGPGDQMRLTHRLAAAAIRDHLWQPHPPGPLGGRPWTMARELQIFDRLARDHDPLVLVGAIAHVRRLTNTRQPARLTWLVHRHRGPALLSRAVAAFHASQDLPQSQPPRGNHGGGGLARISVELPPPNRQPLEVTHDE